MISPQWDYKYNRYKLLFNGKVALHFCFIECFKFTNDIINVLFNFSCPTLTENVSHPNPVLKYLRNNFHHIVQLECTQLRRIQTLYKNYMAGSPSYALPLTFILCINRMWNASRWMILLGTYISTSKIACIPSKI